MSDAVDDAMFRNAIASIEAGVEDFRNSDPKRATTATRNLHAGVLLLLKEVLHRYSPELVAARVAPIRKNGQVVWVADGTTTLDLQGIQSRWRSLGLQNVDWSRLRQLQEQRNALEHHAPRATRDALRETVASTFVLVDELVRVHLAESPARLLSEETWESMRSEAGLHKKLSSECRSSRLALAQNFTGLLHNLLSSQLRCGDCGSELLRFHGDKPYPDRSVECVACGVVTTVRTLVEVWVSSEASLEAYSQKGVGPISWGQCPCCFGEAHSTDENHCLLCLERKEYDQCYRCDEPLGLDEQELDGLCGYCSHVMSAD